MVVRGRQIGDGQLSFSRRVLYSASVTKTTMELPTNGLPTWQQKAEDKRQRILSQLPSDFLHADLIYTLDDPSSVQDAPLKYLSPLELEITRLDAPAIVAAVAQKKYAAVEVLNAFTHRATIGHQLLNCCLDIPYHAALSRAKELDDYFARTRKTVGPLHGLPISVKDQCRMIGTETTCGFIFPLEKTDTEDATIVKLLQDAGAIIFAKTNLSMGCMWGESMNNILPDRTCNPFNRTFSCGGSSGGEGALVGFHGSPIGIGTDLGGSIRSPSAYQGLFGLRPTSGRIPYYRMLNSMEGQQTVLSVAGPMATSVEAVELFMKTIVQSQPWLQDPGCIPLPWNQANVDSIASNGKLRIGVFDWDGVCFPQPPIRNAMKKAVVALEAAGHELVTWKMDTLRAVELILRVFRSDAAGDIYRKCALSGESPMTTACERDGPSVSLLEDRDLAMEVLDFRAAMSRQWNDAGIDAYISPVNPAVAPRHGDYSKVRYFAYTAVANVLDLPACTLPMGLVDPTADQADDVSLTRDTAGNVLPVPTCERDEIIRRKYGAEVYAGMPVTIQVVGRRFEDEKVIGIVKTISNLLGSK